MIYNWFLQVNSYFMLRRRRTPADIAAYIAQLSSDESGSDADSSISDADDEILHMSLQSNQAEEGDELSDPEDADLSEDQSHGRDGTTWERMTSSVLGRSSAHNVFKVNPGPKSPSSLQTTYDTWKLFIDGKMLRVICECTNHYAATIGIELNMTFFELEAFIALQYSRRTYNRTLALSFLWKKVTDHPFLQRQCLERDSN